MESKIFFSRLTSILRDKNMSAMINALVVVTWGLDSHLTTRPCSGRVLECIEWQGLANPLIQTSYDRLRSCENGFVSQSQYVLHTHTHIISKDVEKLEKSWI